MFSTRRIVAIALVLLVCPFVTHAASTSTLPTTRTVGVGKQYALPSQAIAAANDGDTILIDPGTYTDDFATISASDVTLKGNGGKARLVQATSTLPNSKAMWIAAGDHITIDSVEFAGAKAAGGSGAGIFVQGAGLTVRNSYFHDDQNGIVAANGSTTDIVIDNTEFARDGNGAGSGNALNIGVVRTFTLRYSYLHDQNTGDVVKTRALKNIIAYDRITGENGTENCEINVPQGGETYIAGTVLQKAISSLNSTLVTYGQEGAINPIQSFNVVNDTLVNDRSSDLYILVGNTSANARIVNNLFVGTGTLVSGATLGNGNVVTQSPAFVDKANYDYHLTAGSPAVGKCMNPGYSSTNINLNVGTEYVHPLSSQPRSMSGTLDAGAFAYSPTTNPGTTPTPTPDTSTTVTLRATPTSIQLGQSALLTWSSTPAASCSSNDFFANGALGSVSVTPATTTVYTIYCGNSSAQARVAVTIPALFSVGNKVGFDSNATMSLRSAPTQNASAVALLNQGITGVVTGGPALAEGTNWFKVRFDYLRYGSVEGWLRQDDLVATTSLSLPPIAFSALPSTIAPGARSFISWSAPTAGSCRGDTVPFSGTLGTIVVTPYQTSTYTILCDNAAASTTVFVTGSSAPPTPAPTPATPVPSPTPTPDASQVLTTDVLNVRASPALSSPVICTQPRGMAGAKVAGPVSMGGHVWWGVNYAQGCDGWSAGEYLAAPGSAPTSPSVRFTRPLSVGSRGADVTELQTILLGLGYFSGDTTGYFGPITRAAVLRLQEHYGLEAVGSVGPRTRALLNQLSGQF